LGGEIHIRGGKESTFWLYFVVLDVRQSGIWCSLNHERDAFIHRVENYGAEKALERDFSVVHIVSTS
jgi:hypothetical protein